MDQNVQDTIRSYIARVASDAFKDEQRAETFTAQFAMLDDTVLLKFKTGFDRVDRRIFFRLVKNFKKNTGFNISFDSKYSRQISDIIRSEPGRLHVNHEQVDPNFTVAYCKLLGKPTAISCYHKTEKTAEYLNPDFDEEAGFSMLWKRFETAGVAGLFYGKGGWDKYCLAYKTVYGHTPPAQDKLQIFPEFKITYDFSPVQN